MNTEAFPQLIHLAQEPLGLFLRPGHSDHALASQLFSEGYTQVSGVVFDPTHTAIQERLREDVVARQLWSVVDSKAMELASPGGFTGKRAELPWAGDSIHTPEKLTGLGGTQLIEVLVDYVGRHGFTAILAPTHYLERGADDPWFAVDRQLVQLLRNRLDRAKLDKVAIYYPLATNVRNFFGDGARAKIKAGLTGLPINCIWLRIEGFGSQTTASSVQKYIRACQDFHSLKHVALVPEKAGTAGQALMAFGAASGVECGISSGEAFRFGNLKKEPEPDKKGFSAHRQVYIPKLGAFLSPKEAAAFFGNRHMKATFGCGDQRCCRGGVEDMIKHPRRHFVITRMVELDHLSHVPAAMRSQSYLDDFLRPATDQASRASRATIPEDLQKKIERARERLDGWRATLGQMAQMGPPQSFAPVVARRVHRLEIGA